MSGKYKNVEEYLNDQPEDARKLLIEMKSLILEVVPYAEEKMNYGVPAYAFVKGGKSNQQVMIAGFKKHVGLYPDPSTIEHFIEALIDYKTSKGTVQFPLDKPLPAQLIKDMIAYRRDMILKDK